MASLEMRQEHECAPTLAQRLRQVGERWSDNLSSFCLIFGFFVGLIFLINPALHTVAHTSFAAWNPTLLFGIGLAFVVLTVYAELYPERNAAYGAVFVEAVVGLASSVHPLSAIGMIFWSLALATIALGVVRRWLALRREERRWSRR